MTYDATEVAYGSALHRAELEGLADGANVPRALVRRVHMLPELTKADCSMVGAWGSATKDGKLRQARALDWDMAEVWLKHQQLTVYHSGPSGNGHAFATLGFIGFALSLIHI